MRIAKSSIKKIVTFIIMASLITGLFGYGVYLTDFVPDSVETVTNDRFDAVFYAGEALPVNHDASRSLHKKECFYRDGNNWLRYDDGETYTTLGVDVSYYQQTIDWKAVKDSGITFAIIRAGYRGYGAGSINKDDYLETNVNRAIEAGLDVGVYFYSQALNVDEAREEAEYVIDLIKDYDLSYPIVFDWEPVHSSDSRTNNVSGKDITDACIAFCDTIEAAGYDSLIYIYRDIAYYKLELERLEKYDIWIAEYNDIPTYYYDYEMVQFTCEGTVPGIEGNVDINLSFKNYSK